MRHFLLVITFGWDLLSGGSGLAANALYTLSGRVTEAKTLAPLPGASVVIKGTYLWAVANQKGEFTINGVQEGKYSLEISFIGYVSASVSVEVSDKMSPLDIQLKENTLALDDVVVTAQSPKNELNTTLTIGSNALEHLQISNVSDVAALLPGGKTKVPDLTTDNVFSLRDGGSSTGNASFGTAVEVNGVRIGNNGSFGSMSGVGTRNIAVADIESVEVITGVPSVEYGDLNSGMVRINTKKRENTSERDIFRESENLSGISLERHCRLTERRSTESECRMDQGRQQVVLAIYLIHETRHVAVIQQHIRKSSQIRSWRDRQYRRHGLEG